MIIFDPDNPYNFLIENHYGHQHTSLSSTEDKQVDSRYNRHDFASLNAHFSILRAISTLSMYLMPQLYVRIYPIMGYGIVVLKLAVSITMSLA